jgi:hypothetical protein
MTEIDIDISLGGVKVLPVPVTAQDLGLLQGRGELCGWSLRETTGAATATVELQDGGNPLGEIQMAAGAVSNAWFGNPGVEIRSQIFLHVVAGSVTGAVYARYY